MHASRRIAASALRSSPAAKRFASSASAGSRHQIEVSKSCSTSNKNALRRPVVATAPHQKTAPQQLHQPISGSISGSRYYSNKAGNAESKQWGFEEIRGLTTSTRPSVSPSSSSSSPTFKPILLIDVREPHEYSAGHIPRAVSMPLQSSPDALLLSTDDFSDKFGFTKPGLADEVVFYCRSGVRSSSSAEIAKSLGYRKVGEYKGSWKDWEERGGETEV